jgi:hypothetical protein
MGRLLRDAFVGRRYHTMARSPLAPPFLSKGRGGTETVDRGLPEVNSSKSRTTVWMQLEEHFARHASMVERFQGFGRAAVVRMWKAQANESGDPLTPAEREALVERHCELFGHWPA